MNQEKHRKLKIKFEARFQVMNIPEKCKDCMICYRKKREK